MALKKALYNYMHGIGLDADVRSWFGGRVPRTTVPRQFIARALAGGSALPLPRAGEGRGEGGRWHTSPHPGPLPPAGERSKADAVT